MQLQYLWEGKKLIEANKISDTMGIPFWKDEEEYLHQIDVQSYLDY